MDSAEQAALSESDHDAQSKRFYETHRFSDYASEGKPGREALLKPMRRFDKLSVNLSLSSILVPSGVELNGKTNITFRLASQLIIKIVILSHRSRCSIINRMVFPLRSTVFE